MSYYYPNHLIVIFVTDQTQLKLLLLFATGQDSIPVMGFIPTPSLKFKFPPEFGTDFNIEANISPTANTCALELFIPVTDTYDTFKTVMLNSIEMFSSVFTNA